MIGFDIGERKEGVARLNFTSSGSSSSQVLSSQGSSGPEARKMMKQLNPISNNDIELLKIFSNRAATGCGPVAGFFFMSFAQNGLSQG
jgi:hypothetical protein